MSKKIDDIGNFVADMANLCMNELYSDVIFLVEDQRLPGHRNVLAARSEYFRCLLYGGLAESKERELRLEVPLKPFKLILSYMYTGTMQLTTLDVDTLIDVLAVAHLYGLVTLVSAMTKHIANILAVENVCIVLEAARRYSLDELTNDCHNFMNLHLAKLLKHQTFQLLSKESLEGLLRLDNWHVPEVDIFRAICKWRQNNPNVDIAGVISLIRFRRMCIDDLLHVVRPSGIVQANEILNVIDKMILPNNLIYRSLLLPGVDVASEKYRARRTKDTRTNDLVIELSNFYIINFIGNFQGNMSHNRNGFHVNVSCDNKQWDCVGTRSAHDLEDIRFTDRSVRYIRVGKVDSYFSETFILAACYLQNGTHPKDAR